MIKNVDSILLQDMVKVPVVHIFTAIIPALMIAALYFFDHSVAAQMAQQKEFNLKKPSAYHYDILLLGFMVFPFIMLFTFLPLPLIVYIMSFHSKILLCMYAIRP